MGIHLATAYRKIKALKIQAVIEDEALLPACRDL